MGQGVNSSAQIVFGAPRELVTTSAQFILAMLRASGVKDCPELAPGLPWLKPDWIEKLYVSGGVAFVKYNDLDGDEYEQALLYWCRADNRGVVRALSSQRDTLHTFLYLTAAAFYLDWLGKQKAG